MNDFASIEGMMIPALKRSIRRALIREQFARSLTDLIAAGLLKVGDELPPERELAAMLEVSHESLRSGLQLLADRGVLNIGQGTRTRVWALTEPGDAVPPVGVPDMAGLTDRMSSAHALFSSRRLPGSPPSISMTPPSTV